MTMRLIALGLAATWSLLPVLCEARMLTGVSLSGAELNANALPGKQGTDYVYPDAQTMHYFASRGANCIRLPVLWERLQPALGGDLSTAELAYLDKAISDAQANGERVIVDIHDYGRWRGRVVGSNVPASAFSSFWSDLSRHINLLPNGGSVIFGLMNEPHDIGALQWHKAEQDAMDAIRENGSRNLVLASGADWDGAHSVVSDGNASLLQTLTDRTGNFAIELHQYLDGDSSGTSADCVTPADAQARLRPATAWLRANHLHGFLGEFAASSTPACLASLDAMLTLLDRNKDVWIGWTDWAGGPWWGHYMFSVQPQDGRDAPQMSVLARHMGEAP